MGNKAKSNGKLVDVLIVAQPNRFRDGLKSIIQALAWVKRVGTVADWTAVSDYVQCYHPALVIYDIKDLDSMTWLNAKAVRFSYENIKCIAIIDRAQQRSMAKAMATDAILLRGFSTDLLYNTMRPLIVDYDPTVPVTGPLGQLPA